MSVPLSVQTPPVSPSQPDRQIYPSSDTTSTIERTSSVIARLSQLAPDRAISDQGVALEEVVDALKDRSFGAMLILFAMPNAVVPGVMFIVGGPIMLIGVQLALGYRKPWLPPFMLKRRFRRATFKTVTVHVGRFLAWLERWLRPRASWLISRPVERFLGLYIAGLAVLLLTPLPLGSTLPALGISLIAAGLAERDGVAVALGLGVGFAGALYAGAFISGVALTAMSLAAR
jgi:hypothetical protein